MILYYLLGVVTGALFFFILIQLLAPKYGELQIDDSGENDIWRWVFTKDPETVKKRKSVRFTVRASQDLSQEKQRL